MRRNKQNLRLAKHVRQDTIAQLRPQLIQNVQRDHTVQQALKLQQNVPWVHTVQQALKLRHLVAVGTTVRQLDYPPEQNVQKDTIVQQRQPKQLVREEHITTARNKQSLLLVKHVQRDTIVILPPQHIQNVRLAPLVLLEQLTLQPLRQPISIINIKEDKQL